MPESGETCSNCGDRISHAVADHDEKTNSCGCTLETDGGRDPEKIIQNVAREIQWTAEEELRRFAITQMEESEIDELALDVREVSEVQLRKEMLDDAAVADGGPQQKTDDDHTEDALSDIVSVTTPEYAHGEIQTEWFTGEVDDRSDVRFSLEVHQDGPDIALSAGTASAEQEKRLYTYHALSPAKAERVGKALLEAADMAKAARRTEPEQQNEEDDSADTLLQRLMGR